jgi:phage tail-like protein
VTLTATAHPAGNRIDVRWPGPADGRYQLLCRHGSYPARSGTGWVGEVVAETGSTTGAPAPEPTPDGFRVEHRRRRGDEGDHDGLVAEIVHYYQLLVPDPADPQRWVGDPADRAAAMATGPYLFAERLYHLLPAVYRRFDSAGAPGPDGPGQLRRFLELVGGQLDQTYSTVRSLSALTDVARVDGRLLPLLAHWVGWRLDQGLALDEQRQQIADAPAVYHGVQTLPTVMATARRLTGWPCAAKEMIDNVAVTNRPERLNLWQRPLAGGPAVGPELLSTDEAGEGRPAVVRHADGTIRMLYSTTRNGRGEIWEKLRAPNGPWTGSRPVVTGQDSYLDPAAALLGETVLLLWSAHRRGAGWRIEYRRLVGGVWGPVQAFAASDGAQRRDPAVAVDTSGAAPVLWLFWREQGPGGRWRLRYQRRTGADPEPATDGIRNFPLDQNADPGVDSGVNAAVLGGRVWLWWARLTPITATGPTRWRCVLRVKDTTGDNETGWGPVTVLGADAAVQDREPVPHVAANGGATVLFSTTRDGSWSVWQVPIDTSTRNWGAPAAVTADEFTDRSPAVLPLDPAVLVHRSSRSITHADRHGRSGTIVDRRYSGAVTVQARNKVRLAQRGTIHDVLAYTSRVEPTAEQVTPRERLDLIASDVLVLFLAPGAVDPDAVKAGVARLRAVLPEFLPITIRTALIIERPA